MVIVRSMWKSSLRCGGDRSRTGRQLVGAHLRARTGVRGVRHNSVPGTVDPGKYTRELLNKRASEVEDNVTMICRLRRYGARGAWNIGRMSVSAVLRRDCKRASVSRMYLNQRMSILGGRVAVRVYQKLGRMGPEMGGESPLS